MGSPFQSGASPGKGRVAPDVATSLPCSVGSRRLSPGGTPPLPPPGSAGPRPQGRAAGLRQRMGKGPVNHRFLVH